MTPSLKSGLLVNFDTCVSMGIEVRRFLLESPHLDHRATQNRCAECESLGLRSPRSSRATDSVRRILSNQARPPRYSSYTRFSANLGTILPALPMAMVAIGIARPTEIRITPIDHAFAIGRNVTVSIGIGGSGLRIPITRTIVVVRIIVVMQAPGMMITVMPVIAVRPHARRKGDTCTDGHRYHTSNDFVFERHDRFTS
jgi:hypothetical protein